MSVKRKNQKNCDRSDEVLNIVANKLQNQSKYAAFGQHVSVELEELSPEMAIYCKKLINEAIFQAQIKKLNETSRIVTDRAPTSFHYYHQGGSLPIETEVVRSTGEATNEGSLRLREYLSQYNDYENL